MLIFMPTFISSQLRIKPQTACPRPKDSCPNRIRYIIFKFFPKIPLSTIYWDVNGSINWISDEHATIRQTENRLLLCIVRYPISLFFVLILSLLDIVISFLLKSVDFDRKRAIPKSSFVIPLYQPCKNSSSVRIEMDPYAGFPIL